MTTMKKLAMIAVLTLMCALTAGAEDNSEKTALKVWAEKDNYQAYNISAKPVIKQVDGKLVMNVNGKTFGTYDIYDGMKITFTKEARQGDVNGDNDVTMADANGIVNTFLNGGARNINVTAADYNADGSITMADANAVVNEFLGQ